MKLVGDSQHVHKAHPKSLVCQGTFEDGASEFRSHVVSQDAIRKPGFRMWTTRVSKKVACRQQSGWRERDPRHQVLQTRWFMLPARMPDPNVVWKKRVQEGEKCEEKVDVGVGSRGMVGRAKLRVHR